MGVLALVGSCLGSCLESFFDFEYVQKKRKLCDYAKELVTICSKNGKNEYYYTKLKQLVEGVRDFGERFDVTSLKLEEFAWKDFSRLQNIIRYRAVKDIPNLEKELTLACKEGFSLKMLQEVVGTLLVVEDLTESGREEKRREYVAILSQDCPICLDSFTEDDFLAKKIHRVMSCHHYFHLACIGEWKKVNPICPVCKINFDFTEDRERWGAFLTSIESVIRKHFNVADDVKVEEAVFVEEELWVTEARKAVQRALQLAEYERVALDLQRDELNGLRC